MGRGFDLLDEERRMRRRCDPQSINVVAAAYVEHSVDHSGRINCAAGGVAPQFDAVCGVQSVNVIIC